MKTLSTQERRQLWRIYIFFGVTFLLGSVLDFVLMSRYKTVALGAMSDLRIDSLPRGHVISAVVLSMGWLDAVVIGGLFLCLVWIIVEQIRWKSLSIFFAWALSSERRTRLVVLGMAVLLLKPILAPGEPYFQDAPSHVSRAWFAYVNFAQGYVFPTFNNYYHAGFAMFSHYGFLFSILAGGLNLLIGNIYLSVKLVMMLASVATAFLFYAVGKQLARDRGSGLLLSIAVTGSNIFLYGMFWVGALFYPLIVAGAGLLLLSFERFMAETWPLYRAAFVTAIAANVLIATHLGYAAQLFLFFVVYAIARLLAEKPGFSRRFAGWAALSLGMALVLSAFVVLPTFLDIKDVNFFKAFPYSDPNTWRFWRVTFWKMLIPHPFYVNALDYLGLALVGIAVWLAVVAVRRPDRRLAAHIASIASVMAVMGYSRNSVVLMIAVALFVCHAFGILMAGRDGNRVAFGFLILFLLADSLMFNNFNTYRTNGAFEDRLYDRLAQEPWGTKLGVVDANSLHSGNRQDNNVYISPWLKISGHLVIQPNAIMLEANKQALYQFVATHDLLGLDMLNGRITLPTLRALDLVGVRYLTFHTSDAYYLPPVDADGAIARDAAGPWIELPGTFPMIFSQRVIGIDTLANADPALAYKNEFEADDVSHDRAPLRYRAKAGDYFHDLTNRIGPSLAQPTADQFILRVPENEDMSSPGKASLQVTSFFVDAQKVVADFTVSKPGFVRIPFGWFPWHTIQLDGVKATAYPDIMNMICVRVDTPGAHHLQVGPSISPAKRAGAWVTGISFIVLLAVLAATELVRQRRREGFQA
ncbi:MAG TPA: hypothetical protein VL354_20250 [Spirochaetia bacterium]|nr:hypothetical protein [Spirochaetia bacterium]